MDPDEEWAEKVINLKKKIQNSPGLSRMANGPRAHLKKDLTLQT